MTVKPTQPRKRPAATSSSGRDLTSQVQFLTRALKAPTLREAVPRLAERARDESWTHEEFLVACLQREGAARESHGGDGRIRAARLPARKSLEDFDSTTPAGIRACQAGHRVLSATASEWVARLAVSADGARCSATTSSQPRGSTDSSTTPRSSHSSPSALSRGIADPFRFHATSFGASLLSIRWKGKLP